MSEDSVPSGSGVVACAVEAAPRFERELLRWFASLTRVAGVGPADLFVGVVGSGRSRALELLRDEGVSVQAIRRFDERSAHCNKIAALLAMPQSERVVVLTDADVAIVDDPRRLEVPSGGIALKTVDAPYPPLRVLQSVFDAAALPRPEIVQLHHVSTEKSFLSNANGGLYVIDGALVGKLAIGWARWAKWLLARRTLLESWDVHVDQVAMALALAAQKVDPIPLEPRWNFPVHVPTWIGPVSSSPAAIHYHDHVDRSGLLRYVGVPTIDVAIERVNAAVSTLPPDLVRERPRRVRLRWLDAAETALRSHLARWAAGSPGRRRVVTAPRRAVGVAAAALRRDGASRSGRA